MSGGPVLGIDLGTTNSVVAVCDGQKVQVLLDHEGNRLVPSVVSFHPSGEVIVGYAARERRLIDAKNTVYSVKRLIGRPFDSPEVKRAKERFAFSMIQGPNRSTLVDVRKETYTLPEISAFVLREVKRIAEQATGEVCTQAVITVPANFNELQRSATKAAGKVAGLDVLRILNEPTAAALAYGFGKGKTSERVAVFDLGGGTFDITILELVGDLFEVLATAGDTFLGGDDLDLAIAEKMAEAMLRDHGADVRADPQAFERLRAAAEWIKCSLSDQPEVFVRLEQIEVAKRTYDLAFGMTQEEFEAIASPILARAFATCDDALRVAKLAAMQLDNVILVGGSTRVPLVRQLVAEHFGREPLYSIDPDLVVAQGAAVHGESLRAHKAASMPVARVALRKMAVPDPRAARREALAKEVAAQRPAQPAFATNNKKIVVPKPSALPPALPPPSAGSVAPPPNSGKRAAMPLSNRPPADASLTPAVPIAAVKVPAPIPREPSSAFDGLPAVLSPDFDEPEEATSVHHVIAVPARAVGGPAVEPARREPSAPRAPVEPSVVDLPGLPVIADLPGLPGIADLPVVPAKRKRQMPAISATDLPAARGPQAPAKKAPARGETQAPHEAAPPPRVQAPLVDPDVIASPMAIREALAPPPALPPAEGSGVLFFDDLPGEEPATRVALDSQQIAQATSDAETTRFADSIPPPPAAPALPVEAFNPDALMAAIDLELGKSSPPPRQSSPRISHPPGGSLRPPGPPPRQSIPPGRASMPPGAPRGDVSGPYPVSVEVQRILTLAQQPIAATTTSSPDLGFVGHIQAPEQIEIMGQGAPSPLLLDVAPQALGVETVGGICEAIIPRNAAIPVEQSKIFTTALDNQSEVRVRIVQGDSRRFDDNQVLGELTLSELRPAPRGKVRIQVSFVMDADGTLGVAAHDLDSGRSQSLRVQLIGAVPDDEIARMAARQEEILNRSA